jgi:hydrogenase maturation protease
VEKTNKVLLLGLGNDILRDDAIGLHVAREVRRRLAGVGNVEVRETTEMGVALLDHIAGFDDLMLVDAIQTGRSPPGYLREFDIADLKTLPVTSLHCLGVSETLALGRKLGMSTPRRVKVFAVEVEDPFTVGTQMTPTLQRVMPELVNRVTAAVLAAAAGKA